MKRAAEPTDAENVLVVVPNWVGDVVLATPVLAALRAHFSAARITFLMRPYVAEVVDGCGWHDESLCWPRRRGPLSEVDLFTFARRLRDRSFDLVLLLTNSFRSAFVVAQARIPRRVGYSRDGRGWLLTDRLAPLKRGGAFVPAPVLPYYIRIAEHVGCTVPDRRLRLGLTDAQARDGEELLRHYELHEDRPYAVINPGAAFGTAKCWPPERFARVCDRLVTNLGLVAVIVGAPGEIPLMRSIADRASGGALCMDDPGTTLGTLKAVVRGASLLICNDTGPRHYGAAFGIPTVTIFGPTHQAWTDTDYEREVKLQAQVECGPCQLRTCPLDLRCMQGVTVEHVMDAAQRVIRGIPLPATVGHPPEAHAP